MTMPPDRPWPIDRSAVAYSAESEHRRTTTVSTISDRAAHVDIAVDESDDSLPPRDEDSGEAFEGEEDRGDPFGGDLHAHSCVCREGSSVAAREAAWSRMHSNPRREMRSSLLIHPNAGP
ncbi:MAG: hypothetical protein R2692_01195 [Microbacterium sp.]